MLRSLIHNSLLVGFAVLALGWLALNWLVPVDLDYRQQSTVVLSREGHTLRHFADDNGVWRYPVPLHDVSPLYIEALVGYEDRWFWHHPGVNPFSLIRASLQAIQHGRIVSGGSTLTMQVARMRYPDKRSFGGKFKEIIRAVQIERHFSKQEILTYYLNHAPFGGTIEGVQAAALSYYGYDAKTLTHAQAALLAVLPQAPSRFRPDRHPLSAEQARNKLLDRLEANQIWPADVVADAKLERVIATPISRYNTAPLLARRLSIQFQQQSIQSTLRYNVQLAAEQLVNNYARLIDTNASAAALVMDSRTGEVITYVGSADFLDDQRSGHVDMVQAIRSPGSTLKPFIYALAMDEGLVHSDSLLMDVPLRFAEYQPENFLGGFSGPTSVRIALQKSLNLPAVQVLEQLGANRFYLALNQAGAALKLPSGGTPNLAIALGGVGTTLEGLVTLYSSLARDGTTIRPRYSNEDAIVIEPLLSPSAAWITRKILFDNIHTPGVALKTGTSYGYRDAWSLAVVGDYTIGVWVGKPDGTPLVAHYGSQTATPLLLRMIDLITMRQAMPAKPDDVLEQSICWPTGQRETQELCDESHLAYTINGTTPQTFMNIKADNQPAQPAAFVGRVAVDSNELVTFGCDVENKELRFAVWPAPLQRWIPASWRYEQRLPKIDSRCPTQWALPSPLPVMLEGIQDGDVRIVAQQNNPTLRLTATGGQAPFTWYINGVISTENSERFLLTLAPLNEYQIAVVDRNGSNDAVSFRTSPPP